MFGDKLKQARLEKGLKQAELGKMLGLKNTTISNWEKGVSNPDVEIISKLCKILDVSASYFFDDLASEEILSFSEKRLIEKYRSLDQHGEEVVNYILNSEYNRCVEEPIIKYKSIDRYPHLASAGNGEYLFDDIPFDKVEIPYDSKADFAIGIKGDSMEPTYFDEETVLIMKTPSIDIGDIGIFIINGESYIKEYRGDRLISHNKSYDDILFTDGMDIRVVGKVIGKLDEDI